MAGFWDLHNTHKTMFGKMDRSLLFGMFNVIIKQ